MKARPKENCSNFWILASLPLHPKASSCLKHFKLKARWQKKIISDLERFEQQGGKWVEICCIFRCHLPASQHEKDLRRNEVIWYFSRSVQNSKFLLVVQIYQNTLSVKYISSLLPSNSHLILFDNNFCLSNAQFEYLGAASNRQIKNISIIIFYAHVFYIIFGTDLQLKSELRSNVI